MSKGIIKVDKPINEIAPFKSVTIIGDPGCDGLGAGTMSVFAKALTALKSDFTLVVGDIVHRGIEPLYASVKQFVDSVAINPVYMLCGNHDTTHYDTYFGLRNYLLHNKDVLFVVLDNSTRCFSEETLHFLEKSLQDYERRNIVLFFHYPAPNSVCSNGINPDDWHVIDNIIKPYRRNIRYIVTGHVHSYYETVLDYGDMLDNIKLIVTGGGGARIEYVNDKIDPEKAHHHVIKLYFDDEGVLRHEHIPLQSVGYAEELKDDTLKSHLMHALENESVAYMKYSLFAFDASEKGYPGIAKLFRALADSEFHHARNHFYVLDKMGSVEDSLKASRDQERYEVDIMYKDYLDYCVERNHGLARYSFYDSFEAEKVHAKIIDRALEEIKNGRDIEIANYKTCNSCGYTFTGSGNIKHCPVCGAPRDRISEVQ